MMIARINIKIKKIHPKARHPRYTTEGSAGCDFYALDDITLYPGEVKKIPTGIALELPPGYFLKLEGRSGLGVRGIMNVGSVIDTDYRGEISIILHNSTDKPYFIEEGDRIAQGVLTPVLQAQFEEASKLSETERGTGGFHSTGKNDE